MCGHPREIGAPRVRSDRCCAGHCAAHCPPLRRVAPRPVLRAPRHGRHRRPTSGPRHSSTSCGVCSFYRHVGEQEAQRWPTSLVQAFLRRSPSPRCCPPCSYAPRTRSSLAAASCAYRSTMRARTRRCAVIPSGSWPPTMRLRRGWRKRSTGLASTFTCAGRDSTCPPASSRRRGAFVRRLAPNGGGPSLTRQGCVRGGGLRSNSAVLPHWRVRR